MFGRAMDEADKTGLALAQKAGNNIVVLDAAETQRWQRAASACAAPGTTKSRPRASMDRSSWRKPRH